MIITPLDRIEVMEPGLEPVCVECIVLPLLRAPKLLSLIFKTTNNLSGATEDATRVRHYTSVDGMKGIKSDGSINPSRGGGVHVEVGPSFGPPRTGAGETGAFGSGAYVEFDAPRNMIPTNVGPRQTAVIPTENSLPINNLNPTFKRTW